MTLLAQAPAAVVFDLDGTLVDNMAIHADAFAEFAARHALPPLTPADRGRFDGRRNRDIFPELLGRTLEEAELAAVIAEKEGLYRTLSRGRLRPLRGLDALLDHLAGRGIPVAVATSAPAENVPHTLGEAGLAERFQTIVRSDEVARGKPAPDVFLEATRRLGVPARACLAFEDAPLGVIAAQAAGMACAAITTSFTAEEMQAHGAHPDGAFADFADFLRAWTAAG